MPNNQLKIIKLVSEKKKEIIKFTQELVKASSVNPYLPNESFKINRPIEKKVALVIFNKLKEFGLKPKLISALKNRPNVFCKIGENKNPSLIFNGHMDTVSVGNSSEWKVNPFSAAIIKNKLFGRGALDMKANLAAMVFATGIISELKPRGSLIFTAVVDEEPGAYSEIGTKYLLKKGLNADACIVGEPGMKKICIGTKGGYRFKIIVKGEAVHTGTSAWEKKEKGANAVTMMAKILLILENLKFTYKKVKIFKNKKMVITPGTLIQGGLGINIVPDYCEATVDIRLLPAQNKRQIKKEIFNSINKLKIERSKIKIEIQDLMFVPSVYINPTEKIVEVLKNNSKAILKKEPQIGVGGPWCDAHFFIEKGIPTICGFGSEGDNVHGANEFVFIASIIKTCQIYILTAVDFLN